MIPPSGTFFEQTREYIGNQTCILLKAPVVSENCTMMGISFGEIPWTRRKSVSSIGRWFVNTRTNRAWESSRKLKNRT